MSDDEISEISQKGNFPSNLFAYSIKLNKYIMMKKNKSYLNSQVDVFIISAPLGFLHLTLR